VVKEALYRVFRQLELPAGWRYTTPQEAFLRVKIEAAKRGIPASRLWGEIVDAYFKARAE